VGVLRAADKTSRKLFPGHRHALFCPRGLVGRSETKKGRGYIFFSDLFSVVFLNSPHRETPKTARNKSSFLFHRVFGCFSALGVKKKSTNNPKPMSSRFVLIAFFLFLGEGGLKTPQTNREKNQKKVLFSVFTHHGVTVFLLRIIW
jgi:hypothetical protein